MIVLRVSITQMFLFDGRNNRTCTVYWFLPTFSYDYLFLILISTLIYKKITSYDFDWSSQIWRLYLLIFILFYFYIIDQTIFVYRPIAMSTKNIVAVNESVQEDFTNIAWKPGPVHIHLNQELHVNNHQERRYFVYIYLE